MGSKGGNKRPLSNGKVGVRKGKENAFARVSMEHTLLMKDKKVESRRRIRVNALQRAVDKKKYELQHYPVEVQEKSKRPKGPKQPSEWKLKGAARPWTLLQRIENGELNEHGEELKKPIETYDLWTKTLNENAGSLAHDPITSEYLKLLRKLAQACMEAGLTDRSIKVYEECLNYEQGVIKSETMNALRAREGLVCSLLDASQGTKARELMDECIQPSAILAYSRVLLEYISWEVLEENGSNEDIVRQALTKAIELNPYICAFLIANETFIQVVEYLDEINREEMSIGSIEECFIYCTENLSLWVDTIGACAWLSKEIKDISLLPTPTMEHAHNEMYLGMYETAIEMYVETQVGTNKNNENDESDEMN